MQVQRGVGTSSNGTAAYAGSINMETMSLAAAPRAESSRLRTAPLARGALSADYATGLLPSHFASTLASRPCTPTAIAITPASWGSRFLSGGYFGDRDILKFTVDVGADARHDGISRSAGDSISIDPPDQSSDSRRSATASASDWPHCHTPASSTTTHRFSDDRLSHLGDGDYDVLLDSLETSTSISSGTGSPAHGRYRRDGCNLDRRRERETYARRSLRVHAPRSHDPLYFNTGHKRDESGVREDRRMSVGRATCSATCRLAMPSSATAPTCTPTFPQSISWSFLNPKVGATYQLTHALSLYASYGKKSREPARNDMFAGYDNLDTSNVAFVGSRSGSSRRPCTTWRSAPTTGAGRSTFRRTCTRWTSATRSRLSARSTSSAIELNKNVASSYRRGIEADVTYRGIHRWLLTGNATESVEQDPRIYRFERCRSA